MVRDILKPFAGRRETIDGRDLQRYLQPQKRLAGTKHAERLIHAVARYFQLPTRVLIGKSRRQTIVRARGLAIVLLRRTVPLSFSQIGRLLGRRDHTTIMHAHARTISLLQEDEELREALATLETWTASET
jgi:chromosomal replication initiator protein